MKYSYMEPEIVLVWFSREVEEGEEHTIPLIVQWPLECPCAN